MRKLLMLVLAALAQPALAAVVGTHVTVSAVAGGPERAAHVASGGGAPVFVPLVLDAATVVGAHTARPTSRATGTSTPTAEATVPASATAPPIPTLEATPTAPPTPSSTPEPAGSPAPPSRSRGYLTTPGELDAVRRKAAAGIEPYAAAVALTLEWADKKWSTSGLKDRVKCSGADSPKFMDEESGHTVVYAKALAYHLTGDPAYAEAVVVILQTIMSRVRTINYEADGQQCQLNFGWGTPELVAAADLIEDYWAGRTCDGPTGTVYGEDSLGTGPCKVLFQNWLVKNPYYAVSETAAARQSNWGAAATNATAYIADYLWDRPEVTLVHRQPAQIDGGRDLRFTPGQAYAYANKLALDRMNGYRVELASNDSCDYLSGEQQSLAFPAVKSQITPAGIIPEDARREEFCNVPRYNGEYQNYPQVHLGNLVQQCELMLRRGDRACYDNIDPTDVPEHPFQGPDGRPRTVRLWPGRGSVERAIDAVIVDAGTEWRHESALYVAYRYYHRHGQFGHTEVWAPQLQVPAAGPDQDIAFGTLTHGFAPGEVVADPPAVAPPAP